MVPSVFFIQDEWQVFGLVISQGLNIVFRGLGDEKIFHFIPIDNFLNFLSYHLFGLHYYFYNILGLLLHLINTLLLYKLARKLFKNNFLALLSAGLFITSSIPNQLIMWPVVSLNVLSLFFGLLAWIFVLETDGKNFFYSGMKVALAMLLSLLTLEYSGGLLVFLPAVAFGFFKKIGFKKIFTFLLPLAAVALLYISLRAYPIIISKQSSSHDGVNVQKFIPEVLIQFPIRYVGQAFLPQQLINDLANIISERTDETKESLFSRITLFSGIIVLLISVSFIITERFKLKNRRWNDHIILSLLFIFCSSTPFLFIPGLAENFTLYPPRYLYFGLVGSVFLLVSFSESILKLNRRKLTILVRAVIILYLLANIRWNWKTSEQLYKAGQIRLGILNEIKQKHPKLSKETIFYLESDSSFYGLPPDERIPPFQSGFGQTLLVWYQADENFPEEFFKNKFLWGITEQGFKESGGRGFGYFRDFEQMANLVSQNKIPQSSIIGFSYNSKEQKVADLSDEVRGRISGYLSNKRKLNLDSFTATASRNLEDAGLAIDGNRESFWDSKLPYDNPQYFEIDLGSSMTIAQLQIDSYNNKNQNEVGYRVVSSNDGKNWTKLFESKILPPNKDGLVELYFKPTKSRFFRIEQIGRHQFASWVIHELSVYEVIQ